MATIASLVVNFMANVNPFNAGVDSSIKKFKQWNKAAEESGINSAVSFLKGAGAMAAATFAMQGIEKASIAGKEAIIGLRDGTLTYADALGKVAEQLPLINQGIAAGRALGDFLGEALYGDQNKEDKAAAAGRAERDTQRAEYGRLAQDLLKIQTDLNASKERLHFESLTEDQRFYAQSREEMEKRRNAIVKLAKQMMDLAKRPELGINATGIGVRASELLTFNTQLYDWSVRQYEAKRRAIAAERQHGEWVKQTTEHLQEQSKTQLDMLGRAAQLWDQTRTPAERYAQQMADLDALLTTVALDADTYFRAAGRYLEEYAKTFEQPERAAAGRAEFRTVDRNLIDIRGLTDMGRQAQTQTDVLKRIDAKLDRYLGQGTAAIS